jgi:hypothetical protein
MDVAKLFHELFVIPNVEIVIALLSKVFCVTDQAPRRALIQGLQRLGQPFP